jgi:Photosynthetic reaction centre cytochrome C subunit
MKNTRDLIQVVAAAAVFALLSAASPLSAQQPPAGAAQGRGGQPQAPPQILPKDIARQDLVATMRTFTAGLGVQCNYCHVQEGQGGRNDMASDEKAPKKVARVMMQVVAHANEAIASAVTTPAAEITKVQCVTCHRGEAIPKNPPPPPAPVPAAAPPGH